MRNRRAQTNCRNEPHYPGAETVTFALGYPDMTCHHATALCPIEAPHMIAECGEWHPTAPEPPNA